MASLHDQFKSLIVEVSSLQDSVKSVQENFDQLNAAHRLQDMEKALSDLNGKAVGSSNLTEETKTQVLDMSRKIKEQQDTLDQLRDQVDRLRQELIQVKARAEAPSVPPPPPPAQTR